MATKVKPKARINFTTTKEIDRWIRTESNKKGISISAFLTMKLYEIREQQKAISTLPEILEAMKKESDK